VDAVMQAELGRTIFLEAKKEKKTTVKTLYKSFKSPIERGLV
jgi:hypothetical protein